MPQKKDSFQPDSFVPDGFTADPKENTAAIVAQQRRKFPTVNVSGVDPDKDRTAGDVFIDQAQAAGDAIQSLPGLMKMGAKEAMAVLQDMLTGKTAKRGIDLATGMAQGAPKAVEPVATLAKQTAELAAPGMVSDVPSPEDPRTAEMAGAAGQNLAVTTLPGAAQLSRMPAKAALEFMSRQIPSKTRAGVKFGQVAAKANPVAINASAADDIALRAQELGGRGGMPGRGSNLPKVFRDYLRTRESNPSMTYAEGRDFAKSSGRLSATEAAAANPEMKMLTGKFYNALKTANREAAESVGMGQVYDQAIKEYARAASLAEKMDVAAKFAAEWALKGTIGYGIYKAID